MRFHWEAIERLAKAHHCEDPTADTTTFRRFLEFWWCRKFNKPLKDPLLASYTLDELTYEYLRHLYHEPDMDPRREMESKEIKSADDEWVKQMLSQVKQPIPTPPEVEKPIEPEKAPESIPEIPNLPEISTKFDE